jgi:hypothetical protein
MYAPLTQFETQGRLPRDERALLHAAEADRIRRGRRRRLSLRLPRLARRPAVASAPC